MSSTGTTKGKTAPAKRKRVARKTAPVSDAAVAAAMAKKPNEFAGKFDKSLTRIAKAMEDFTKAVSEAQDLDETVFAELDADLNAKKQMIEYLNTQYDEQKRTRCLDIDIEVKKHGVNACTKLLEPQGLMVVNRAEYDALVQGFKALQESHEAKVTEAVKAANDHNQKALTAIKQTMELTNQATAAKSEAELDAQKEQVRMLKARIVDLRQDVKEQMLLTKEITASNAAAAAAQNQMMRTQTSSVAR